MKNKFQKAIFISPITIIMGLSLFFVAPKQEITLKNNNVESEQNLKSRITTNNNWTYSNSSYSSDTVSVISPGGLMYSWGSNKNGMIDNDSQSAKTSYATPTLNSHFASQGIRITNVSYSSSHAIASDSDGNIYTWGLGESGQLGNGGNSNIDTPTIIGNIPFGNVTKVHAGEEVSYALYENGDLYAWGKNKDGMFGSSSLNYDVIYNSPQHIRSDISDFSVGNANTYAINKYSRTLFAAGSNRHGQIGTNNNENIRFNTFQEITSISGVTKVSAGFDHVNAVVGSNELYTWGRNINGQLGIGTDLVTHIATPQKINTTGVITSISSGVNSSSAVIGDQLLTTGLNENNSIGHGKDTRTEYYYTEVGNVNSAKEVMNLNGAMIFTTTSDTKTRGFGLSPNNVLQTTEIVEEPKLLATKHFADVPTVDFSFSTDHVLNGKVNFELINPDEVPFTEVTVLLFDYGHGNTEDGLWSQPNFLTIDNLPPSGIEKIDFSWLTTQNFGVRVILSKGGEINSDHMYNYDFTGAYTGLVLDSAGYPDLPFTEIPAWSPETPPTSPPEFPEHTQPPIDILPPEGLLPPEVDFPEIPIPEGELPDNIPEGEIPDVNLDGDLPYNTDFWFSVASIAIGAMVAFVAAIFILLRMKKRKNTTLDSILKKEKQIVKDMHKNLKNDEVHKGGGA